MKPRLFKCLLIAACAMTPLAAAAPSHAQSVTKAKQDIALSIGNGQLISVPGAMTDVFVANDSVADVQIKSTRQLYLFGKAGGTTTVYASNAAGEVIWSANVRVGSNIDSVDAMLHLAMPDARIAVSTVGTSTFLLTGTVRTPEDVAEAERLVKAYVGDTANVISRLTQPTPVQVMLKVRIAEVSRSLVRQLGINVTTSSSSGFQFGIGQGSLSSSAGGTTLSVGSGDSSTVTSSSTGTTIAAAGKLLGIDILGSLDAGETVGLATTLAEPNLTTLSGETADFLAGGEYPIPISQGTSSGSTVTIEYKKYGVSLSYTPFVLANGRISLRVRPEVSELSSQGQVTLNGYDIPALTIRRAETTVELGSGQSFMIAGLLSSYSQNSIQKMPGAGDLPVLGALFRSTNYKRGETELVIVVTPYLVKPVDDSKIALPTDGFSAPNALQQFLGNQQNQESAGPRPGPTMAPSSDANAKVGEAGDTATPAGKDKKDKSSRRTAAADDSAKPGFDLK